MDLHPYNTERHDTTRHNPLDFNLDKVTFGNSRI